jgi:hypothetical protein
MRRVFEAFVLCSSLVLGGCGGSGSSSTATAPAAQHGGNVVTLPGGKGFAELLIDKSNPVKVASKTRLLAYFYQPDGTSALTPAPSDVKVRLGSAESGKDVKLTAQSAPAGLFASEPGQFRDELRGELELTLGGEPLQTAFMFR